MRILTTTFIDGKYYYVVENKDTGEVMLLNIPNNF